MLRQSNAPIPELSLVATLDNIVVGYILFMKIQIVNDSKNEFESLALAPMAVKPKFQHKGIGGQLIKYGFNVARNLKYNSIIVLGHKMFYRKFGFDTAAKWGIKPPFKLKDEENYMAIELIKDGLKNVSGLVKYSKEFKAV
jgi:putative acetyltransferase